MSINLVRMRDAVVAAKIETTAGTDSIGGSPASTDWVAGTCEVRFNPRTTDNPELTGSLDSSAPIVGGLMPQITLRVPLRGSGTAGTAPEFGKLLRACSYAELVTSSAVGAPTALPASGHTATSVTLASTPFTNTGQEYRGMPLLLSGVVTATTGITDYTTGRVATLLSTLGATPAATTSAQIPINVRYAPTSDETVSRTVTIYAFYNGIRYRFVGCVGNVALELTSGESAMLVFSMRGQFLDKATAAVPAGWASVSRPTPPRWVGGLSQLGQVKAQVRSLTFDTGIQVLMPDDPEAAEGFGSALPMSRAASASLDPYMDTTTTVSLFNNFRNGVNMPLGCIIGSTAGNRFLITAPSARVIANDPNQRDGLMTNAIQARLEGPDASLFISQF